MDECLHHSAECNYLSYTWQTMTTTMMMIIKFNHVVYSKFLEHPAAQMSLDDAFAKIVECMSETSNQCKVQSNADNLFSFILPFCYQTCCVCVFLTDDLQICQCSRAS